MSICKNYRKCEKDTWNHETLRKRHIDGILAQVFVKNSNCLRSADTSVTECNEIVIFMINSSTQQANTVAINVTITVQ